jgi:RHS repeat-associated protein
MGENFQVNRANGTFSLRLPIHTTPGPSGFGPSLDLSYDSGHGNGPFGIGWSLGLGGISRQTSNGIPKYDHSDVFILSGVDDLVPRTTDATEGQRLSSDGDYCIQLYRPRTEDHALRIEKWTSCDDETDVHWRTISDTNVTTVYGDANDSRLVDTTSALRIFSWLPCRSWDAYGHEIEYEYKAEDAEPVIASDDFLALSEMQRSPEVHTRQRHLRSIRYGNRAPNRDLQTWVPLPRSASRQWCFEVIFDYGEHDLDTPTAAKKQPQTWSRRLDPFSVATSGFEIRSSRLCRRVLMFHHFKQLKRDDCLVASTLLQYNESPSGSFLRSVQRQGHRPKGEAEYTTETLPPFEFVYNLNRAQETLPVKSLENFYQELGPARQSTHSTWVDLNGDGAPGLFHVLGDGSWLYQRNENALLDSTDKPPCLNPPMSLSSRPNSSKASDFYLTDLDGKGQLDLVYSNSAGIPCGYVERCGTEWAEQAQFQTVPLSSPNQMTQQIDLTGNGLEDLLFIDHENGYHKWYQSLGKVGFAAAQSLATASSQPVLVGQNKTIAVFVADMTGDGLTDIVAISNGSVSYWQNLGFGRFSPEVSMSHAPWLDQPDQFSTSRLRLADVDGSGTADLLYMPTAGGIQIYPNCSGNGWGKERKITSFPAIDDLSSVAIVDLLGKGTPCICWTGLDVTGSRPSSLFYIDLMSGSKPNLLCKYTNGLGRTTKVSYRPSTQFFLEDERNGCPWTTRLPFPVHCVHKTTETDLITNTSYVSRFAYHEGYFDPEERSFRGFGMVEEWDAAEFDMGPKQTFKKPPIHSKTWFHTGSPKYTVQYPHPDFPSKLSDSYIVGIGYETAPFDLSRALHGQQLRQEIYCDDGSALASVPFSVTEASFRVSQIQRRDGDRPGVLMLSSHETVFQEVDRSIPDGHINLKTQDNHVARFKIETQTHRSYVLATNHYGDLAEVIDVSFGKVKSELSSPEDCAKQQETIMTLTTTQYTDDVDDLDNYRRPVVCETTNFRIAGISPATFAEVDADFGLWIRTISKDATVTLDENAASTADKPVKIVVAKTRHYQQAEDFSDRLKLDKLEPFSTSDRSYDLVFTQQLLQSLYGDLPGQASIKDDDMRKGGYELLDDGCWWSPTPKIIFGSERTSTLSAARASFYTPTATQDAFGNVTRTRYDETWMLVTDVTDAVENQLHHEYDYVSLQPTMTTDANDNRVAFLYDCFADQVGIARMGKEKVKLGEPFDRTEVPSEEVVRSFLQQPHQDIAKKLLGPLTSLRLVDMNAYYRGLSTGQVRPTVQALLVRDRHIPEDATDEATILIHLDYLDGSGKVLQSCDFLDQSTEEQWSFSSLVVHDNVGNPVQEFRPYYSRDHKFRRQPNKSGPATTYLYDSRNRPVAILSPDHSFTKVKLDMWSRWIFSAGNNVLTSDASKDPDVGQLFARLPPESYHPSWLKNQEDLPNSSVANLKAVQKSSLYDKKPHVEHYDALHRTILSITDNGSEKVEIRHLYDLRGNHVSTTDPKERVVESLKYDLLGRVIQKTSMDSGSEWSLLACDGQPMYHWNSRGIHTRKAYDALRRLVAEKVSESQAPERTVKLIRYGEGAPEAKDQNLRGQVYQEWDQAGMTTYLCYDLDSNCVQTERQLASDFKTTLDWATDQVLEDEKYVTQENFDALGRTVTCRNAKGATTKYEYNRAGATKAISWRPDDTAEWTTYVKNTLYDADGLVTQIDYGNGVNTRFGYDALTRQVINKKTVRVNGSPKTLQDLTFTYDIEHRMILSSDAAQSDVFFRNAQVSADREFTYNAAGELIEARGREFLSTADGQARICSPYSSKSPCSQELLPANGAQLCRYMETYLYDKAGNITQMTHELVDDVGATGWTRDYVYDSGSNKLLSTTVGKDKREEKYSYEEGAGQQGCMTAVMPGYSALVWDFDDQLRATSTQRKNKGTPETTWYVYDSSGHRVRKVTELASDNDELPLRKKCETIYLPDVEIYKVYEGDGQTVRKTKTSHTATAAGLVATIEQTIEKENTSVLVRYSVGTSMEVDDQGQLISYEEYSPFGSTTYVACGRDIEAPSRYRYAAYERDRETGLYYCEARYYASWLGRWLSPDPGGTIDGLNLFAYCRNDPVNYHDPSGTVTTQNWERYGGIGLGGDPRPKKPHVLKRILKAVIEPPVYVVLAPFLIVAHVLTPEKGPDEPVRRRRRASAPTSVIAQIARDLRRPQPPTKKPNFVRRFLSRFTRQTKISPTKGPPANSKAVSILAATAITAILGSHSPVAHSRRASVSSPLQARRLVFKKSFVGDHTFQGEPVSRPSDVRAANVHDPLASVPSVPLHSRAPEPKPDPKPLPATPVEQPLEVTNIDTPSTESKIPRVPKEFKIRRWQVTGPVPRQIGHNFKP